MSLPYTSGVAKSHLGNPKNPGGFPPSCIVNERIAERKRISSQNYHYFYPALVPHNAVKKLKHVLNSAEFY
jgi:hypothetical protein